MVEVIKFSSLLYNLSRQESHWVLKKPSSLTKLTSQVYKELLSSENKSKLIN